MKTVWVFYMLIFFNGESKLEIKEYATEQECEQEKVRIKQEIKEVYNIDAEAHCLYTLQSTYN